MTLHSTAQVAARRQRIEQGLLRQRPLASEGLKTTTLAERMALFHVPGYSVAVINDGQIEWAAGYGVREAGGDDPVTPATLFQACSISKPVTALGVLRLVAQGVLDLAADVNDYLTSWRVPANGGWQPRITLRQLLSHTAGTSVQGFPGYNRRGPIPTLREVLAGGDRVNTWPVLVNGIPGTQFRYSGGGTSIVQQVLEDVTGQPFPELMQTLVLQPLGMTNSTFAQPLPEALWPQAAAGHWEDGGMVADQWHVQPETAACGLWTTPTDLCRLALAVQRMRAGQEPQFLPRTLVDDMLTRHPASTYGIGFEVEGSGDRVRFVHGGDSVGYRCYLVAYADHGQGAVVMSNADLGWAINEELLRAVALEYDWPTDPDYLWLGRPAPTAPPVLDATALAALAGTYELRPDFRLVVQPQGEGLLVEATGQPAFVVTPRSATEFAAAAVNAEIAFTRSETGTVTGLTLRQHGATLAAQRV